MKQLINSITILTITITFVACGDSEILLDSERTYGIRHDRTLEMVVTTKSSLLQGH